MWRGGFFIGKYLFQKIQKSSFSVEYKVNYDWMLFILASTIYKLWPNSVPQLWFIYRHLRELSCDSNQFSYWEIISTRWLVLTTVVQFCLDFVCRPSSELNQGRGRVKAGHVTGSHPPSPRGNDLWTCGGELVLYTGERDWANGKRTVLWVENATPKCPFVFFIFIDR